MNFQLFLCLLFLPSYTHISYRHIPMALEAQYIQYAVMRAQRVCVYVYAQLVDESSTSIIPIYQQLPSFST